LPKAAIEPRLSQAEPMYNRSRIAANFTAGASSR
jgi:hypothetical protein